MILGGSAGSVVAMVMSDSVIVDNIDSVGGVGL